VELQDEDCKVQKPNFTKAILHFSICILIFALSESVYTAFNIVLLHYFFKLCRILRQPIAPNSF